MLRSFVYKYYDHVLEIQYRCHAKIRTAKCGPKCTPDLERSHTHGTHFWRAFLKDFFVRPDVTFGTTGV